MLSMLQWCRKCR